jgi:hypothetical protein
MTILEVLIVFLSAGFSLKVADEYGEKGNNLTAFVSAAVCSILFWLLVKEDVYYSTVIFAVIIGSVLSLKTNRPNLVFGLAVVIVLSIFLGFRMPIIWLLITLSAIAFFDEICHEKFLKKSRHSWIFQYRLLLKIAVVISAIFYWLTILSAIGFLIFDFSYDLTDLILRKLTLSKNRPANWYQALKE